MILDSVHVLFYWLMNKVVDGFQGSVTLASSYDVNSAEPLI